jgi:Fic family protein
VQNKEGYYNGLNAVSQRGNWHEWMMYMLTAIEQTANTTWDKINNIVSVQTDILTYLKDKMPKIRRPDDLVDAIFTQPFTKVKHLTDQKIYAENTARNYLNELCKIGMLEKKELEGHHYYKNIELHRILGE